MGRYYPYIKTADNKLAASYQYNYTTDEATVIILPDQEFWLDGRWVNTSWISNTNRTFVFNGTDMAAKHIYYTHTGGFQVGDTNSAYYNPNNLPEDDPAFDSNESKMLCAVYYGGDQPEQFVLLRNGELVTDFMVPDDINNTSDLRIEHVDWGYYSGPAVRYGCTRFYKVLDWARAPKYGQFSLDKQSYVYYYSGTPGYIGRFITKPGVQYKYDETREYNVNDRTPIYKTTRWTRRNVEVIGEYQTAVFSQSAEQIANNYLIQGRVSAEDFPF